MTYSWNCVDATKRMELLPHLHVIVLLLLVLVLLNLLFDFLSEEGPVLPLPD
jgi:hypothetical protein